MGFFSFLGVLSPAHITLFSWVSGSKFVGLDELGNKYYRAKARPGYKRERRWVMYNGVPEASKIPPEWHGWLHHQSDDVPAEQAASYRRKFSKPHKANMTGTNQAYRPPGHILEGGQREKVTGDYEAWTPPQ